MKLVYFGEVKGGKLSLPRNQIKADVSGIKDMRVMVTIEPKKSKRSLLQNAYYWGVVVECYYTGLKDLGYEVTKSLTHEFIKGKFCKKDLVNESTGEVITVTGSTTEMGKLDFCEFIDAVIKWAAENLSIQIPFPNEQLTLEIE